MLRKFVLLASALAAVAAATALSAGADITTATFTLTTAGVLSISAPTGTPVSLATQMSSNHASTVSGQLGTVTVSDQRGGAQTWTATAISSAFTPTIGPAVTAIAASAVSYSVGTITQSGVVATGVDAPALTAVVTVVTGVVTGLSTASWNPTISVAVPAGALPGTYTATITHSVV